uniref:Putative tick transposon n=1 Tax=Rhipicephalus microplus TaxID=6941 RepID=A0A6G5A9L2_RHIMP
MVGFRAGLSTQDALKLIKHQVIDNETRDVRAILCLDLEKAFDNIHHSFILEAISKLGLGKAFYDYVWSFLTDRKAVMKIADIETAAIELEARGTPQGAVISPMLFNIAMIGLSKKLSSIEGLKHSIYADDITIWCTGGSEGQIESALQEAIDTVEEYLSPSGLTCFSSKSELLLYRTARRGPKPRGWKSLNQIDIHLHTN